MTGSINLNAFRNHDGTTKYKIRKDYTLTMKYCQISDIVLPIPTDVIDYHINDVPVQMLIDSGLLNTDCYSTRVRY